jgi:ankyrin repeat protein
MSLLQSKDPAIQTVPSLSLQNYFLQYSDAHYDSYDAESIAAIRGQDLDALRALHGTEGRTLQATNRFGESLLHMACRRGFTRTVHYLLTEAGVTPRVVDDCGRTPLHDACWTSEPNFDLMELLIRACPELLVMTDRRGSSPFEYIRGEHACAWMKFLSENKSLIQSDETISRVKAIMTKHE